MAAATPTTEKWLQNLPSGPVEPISERISGSTLARSGNPAYRCCGVSERIKNWIPAFAGMTGI